VGVLIDTSALPASERFDSWREWWARPKGSGVPPIEVSAATGQPFDGVAALFVLGAVTVLHVRSAAAVTTLPPASLAALHSPAVLVVLQHRGRGTYLFPSGASATSAGVITTFRESELWSFTAETPSEYTVLKAQPRDLGPRCELRAGALVREPGGFAPALEAFVRNLARGLIDGSVGEGDPGLDDCLLGAMRAVLATAGGEGEGRQAQLLARIKTHIDANLADPGLTPRAIAARHYISVRQLHKLFEAEPLTVNRWIRHRRLDRCRAELADPARVEEPVHAIAARWRLGSPSHFAHAFRLAYGCSPQEYRRRRAGAGPSASP
jgi:AraC-like DNA-binding protein